MQGSGGVPSFLGRIVQACIVLETVCMAATENKSFHKDNENGKKNTHI